MNASALHDVAVVLRNTPYAAPLLASAARYLETGSLAYVEIALERDYYARLLEAIRALGGQDAWDGAATISTEIDLINLGWLARLQYYHKVGTGQFAEFVIPGPSPLSRQLVTAGFGADPWSALSKPLALKQPVPGAETGSTPERLALFEQLARAQAAESAKGLLARYPFSIAGILAFYLLKRLELQNLCSLFAGKAAGLEETELARHLGWSRD